MSAVPPRVLALLFALGLAVNLSYVLAFDGVLRVTSDAAGYDVGGFNLAQGKGFPNEGGLQPRREPGMYVFLAAIDVLFGHHARAARIVQAVLTSTFGLLVFLICARLSRAGKMPMRVPFVAAVLTILYPGFIFYAGVLMRETLLTFFFLVSLVFLTGYMVSGRVKEAAGYGVFTGLAALVDSRLMYFPIFFGAVHLLAVKDWRRTAVFFAAAFGVALLVVLPWTVRNYIVFGRVVLLATAPAKGLWLVTNPQNIEEWDFTREPLKSLRGLPDEERDKAITRLAIQNLKDYPGRYAISSLRRGVRLWLGGGHSNVNPLMEGSLGAAVAAREWGYAALKAALAAVNYLYVLGGFAGALLYIRRYGFRAGGHFVAFLGYLSVVHSLHFSTPRYQIPALPILTIFLAYVLAGAFTADASLKRAPNA